MTCITNECLSTFFDVSLKKGKIMKKKTISFKLELSEYMTRMHMDCRLCSNQCMRSKLSHVPLCFRENIRSHSSFSWFILNEESDWCLTWKNTTIYIVRATTLDPTRHEQTWSSPARKSVSLFCKVQILCIEIFFKTKKNPICFDFYKIM